LKTHGFLVCRALASVRKYLAAGDPPLGFEPGGGLITNPRRLEVHFFNLD
jgi:hypothetical protein